MKKLLRKVKRALVQSVPWLSALREDYQYLRKLAYYRVDAARAWRFMRWREADRAYWQLSSELIFQFHKIEKGLCMPGKPRFFGELPVKRTMRLIQRWQQAGLPASDPVHRAAQSCLVAYQKRMRLTPPPATIPNRFLSDLEALLGSGRPEDEAYSTPCPLEPVEAGDLEALQRLVRARRSVRSYSPQSVPMEAVSRAVSMAQLSPSACNRQPWQVHQFDQRERIDSLLKLQNGNAGFGHTVPLLLILTAKTSAFFDGSERNQPYIDGGLFTMSLILALQAQGLSSCCLNWCVTPELDRRCHAEAPIPDDEHILMYLAVGYAADGALAPRSARRDPGTVLVRH